MLSADRPLLHVPGASRFIAGGALARLGGAMFGVAAIAMISSRRGSSSLAGAVSSVAIAALPAAGPVIGWLIDRYGQPRGEPPMVRPRGPRCSGETQLGWCAYAPSAVVTGTRASSGDRVPHSRIAETPCGGTSRHPMAGMPMASLE